MRALFILSLFVLAACCEGEGQLLTQPDRRGGQMKVDLTGKTSMQACGDSFTQSQGATTGAQGYLSQYATARGLSTTNVSVGGRGIWNQQAAMQGATFTRTTTLISVLVGLNDIKRNGNDPKTLKKIESGFKAIALKAMNAGAIYSGSASVTRTGTTFTIYNAAAVGGLGTSTGSIPGNKATFNNAAGVHSWEYTFTGTNIAAQMIGADGTTYTMGTCDIFIDGVLQETIDLDGWYDAVSDGAYDNGRGPVIWWKFGLTNASHTIKIEANGDGFVPVDFFCQLLTPANSAALLFWEIPYCTATGYLSPPNGSMPESNDGSLVIRQVVKDLRAQGYNAGYAQTMNFYNQINSGDGTHPNNTGYDQITNAGLAASSP
jgi:lysophospholipase L1-like esterase